MCCGGKKDKSECLYCPLVACDCMLPPWMRAKVRQSYCTYQWGQNPVVQLPCPGSVDYRSWWCKQMRRQAGNSSADARNCSASTSYNLNTPAPRHQSQLCYCANSQSVGNIPSFYQPAQNRDPNQFNPRETPFKSLPSIPNQSLIDRPDLNQTCAQEVEVSNWTMEKNGQNIDNFNTPLKEPVTPAFRSPGNPCSGLCPGFSPKEPGNMDSTVNNPHKKGRWSLRDFLCKKSHPSKLGPPVSQPSKLGQAGCQCTSPPGFNKTCVGINNASCNCGKQ